MAKWKLKDPDVGQVMTRLDWLIERKYLDWRFDDLQKDMDIAEEIVEDDDLWNQVQIKHDPATKRQELKIIVEALRA